MRRDVCYFFPVDVVSLYNAYLTAAKNPPFERSCKEEPYHTFAFGISSSFKYNINGGACTLHFMPYQGGAAVDLRFTLAQLLGARYGKYAEELTSRAAAILRVSPNPININVEEFLRPENKVSPSDVSQESFMANESVAPSPQAFQAPFVSQQSPQPQPPAENQSRILRSNNIAGSLCNKCGCHNEPGSAFCSKCGASLVQSSLFCSGCGAKVPDGSVFCNRCGKRL